MDLWRQVSMIIFGTVLSALIGSGVKSLERISEDIQRLNTAIAVILEKVTDHDRRIGLVERELETGR